MSTRLLLLVSACLMAFSAASAQFVCFMYSTVPLDNNCEGVGAPLPSTCIGVIYWDQNANGPDPSDLPPIVGEGYMQANRNSFTLNGPDYGLPEGCFVVDPAFTYASSTPDPARFYVVIECESVRYTSFVFTITGGYSEVVLDSGWTCETLIDTCSAPINLDLWQFEALQEDNRRRVHSECIWLCADVPVVLHIANLYDPWFYRHAFAILSPGCGSETACNSDVVSPAANPLWENGLQIMDFTDVWNVGDTFIISSSVDGWACLYIDVFLPVEQGSLDAVAGDGRVALNWSTLSETGVERFEILRKTAAGEYQAVGSIPAENNATGAQYSFVDEPATNGVTYIYTLSIVNLDGSRQEWGTEVTATPHAELVSSFALHQNYPNPFNPETRIEFDLANDSDVSLEVHNISGQVVATLAKDVMSAGAHFVSFDASALSAGVYFYTLQTGGFTDTKKMLLLK